MKEIKQEIEDETPLTQEQYRKVKRDLSRLESNYHEEIVSKINEIDQLNKIIEESSSKDHVDFNKIKANISGKKEIVSELDENLRDVLVYVSQHQEEDSAFVDVYYQKSKFSKLKAEYYLESLVEKEYIKQTFGEDPFDPPLFSLTAKGRKFLVEHDLVP